MNRGRHEKDRYTMISGMSRARITETSLKSILTFGCGEHGRRWLIVK